MVEYFLTRKANVDFQASVASVYRFNNNRAGKYRDKSKRTSQLKTKKGVDRQHNQLDLKVPGNIKGNTNTKVSEYESFGGRKRLHITDVMHASMELQENLKQ